MSEVEQYRTWLRRAEEDFSESNDGEHTTITIADSTEGVTAALVFKRSNGQFLWPVVAVEDT